MIHIIWIAYNLLIVICAALWLIGLLFITELGFRIVDIIKERKDVRRNKRNRVAWKKAFEERLKEYDLMKTKIRLHEIERKEFPLFFWKEGINEHT